MAGDRNAHAEDPRDRPLGQGPDDIAVTPDGGSAYVGDSEPAVSQYTIEPLTETLTPKTPATVASGTGPSGVAVSPNGKSAYVANEASGIVSQYTIEPLTETLTPKTPANVSAGKNPAASL